MENQHRQIKGYRELSQAEIDLMNEIKALGPQLEALTAKIEKHIDEQFHVAALGSDELARLHAADPHHWNAWGRTSLQASLMYLTRAVAQPTFF